MVGTKVPEKIEVPAYQPTLARDPDYIYRLEYVEPPRTVPLTDALPPPPTAVVEDTYIDETGTEVDRESVVAVFDDADVYTIIEVNNLVLRRVWRFEDAKTAVDAREYLTRENEASYTLISKSPEEAIETAIQSPLLEVDIDS